MINLRNGEWVTKAAANIQANMTREMLDADSYLQASRRVDWRFLMPNPKLGHVAYIGPESNELQGSLQLFSQSFKQIQVAGSVSDEDLGESDLVVLVEPTSTVLRSVVQKIKSDAYIYIEAHRQDYSFRLRRINPGHLGKRSMEMQSAADYVKAMEQLGLRKHRFRSYWHWPNFDACTRIIPLDEEYAFRFALTQIRTGLTKRMMTVLGSWLLRNGLLLNWVPYYSFIVQPSEA